MKTNLLKVFLVGGAVVALSSAEGARNINWIGGGSGDLLEPANWDKTPPPQDDSGDSAYVTGSGAEPWSLFSTGDFATGSLYFRNEDNVELPIDVDLRDHSLYLTNVLSYSRGLFAQGRSVTLRNGTVEGMRIVLGGEAYPEATLCFSNATLSAKWWAMSAAATNLTVAFKDSQVNSAPVFRPNTHLVLDNSVSTGNNMNDSGGLTSIHLKNGAFLGGLTSRSAHETAHVVVEGGSTFNCVFGGAGGFWLGQVGGKQHDSVIAFTNSTLDTSRFYLCGTNDTMFLHNSRIILGSGGSSSFYMTGVSNQMYVTGTDVAFTNVHAMSLGTASLISVADGVTAVFGDSFSASSAKNCHLKIGTNAVFSVPSIASRSKDTDGDGSSGNVYEVGSGARVRISSMRATTGVSGQTNLWCISGQVRTNLGLDLGTYATSNGNRVELIGDDARLLCGLSVGGSTGHMTIGNTTNPDSITVLFKPGPNGFDGEPPLTSEGYTFGQVKIHKANFEIDLREYSAALPARGEVYRLPLIKTGIYSSMTGIDDLEELNAKAKILPDGGRLVAEGRVLYCEFYKKPGLLILVR